MKYLLFVVVGIFSAIICNIFFDKVSFGYWVLSLLIIIPCNVIIVYWEDIREMADEKKMKTTITAIAVLGLFITALIATGTIDAAIPVVG